MADYKKPDYWQLKARDEGYPARSVYKLKEIDAKFGLLQRRGRNGTDGAPLRVLDLGAAPGSWSLYILRTAGAATLVSADLCPLSREFDRGLFDSDRFSFIQGDITDPAVRAGIVSGGPYHLIVSDAAPATTGNRSVDTVRSMELAEAVLACAESSLLPGSGSLVLKLFQGAGSADFLKRLRTVFTTAQSYKPAACRSNSFETYCIGRERRN